MHYLFYCFFRAQVLGFGFHFICKQLGEYLGTMKVNMVLRYSFNSPDIGILYTNYVHGHFAKGWRIQIEREHKRTIWRLE